MGWAVRTEVDFNIRATANTVLWLHYLITMSRLEAADLVPPYASLELQPCPLSPATRALAQSLGTRYPPYTLFEVANRLVALPGVDEVPFDVPPPPPPPLEVPFPFNSVMGMRGQVG